MPTQLRTVSCGDGTGRSLEPRSNAMVREMIASSGLPVMFGHEGTDRIRLIDVPLRLAGLECLDVT